MAAMRAGSEVGGEQCNEVQARLGERPDKLVGLLRGQVDDEEAIDTNGLCVLCDGGEAIPIERVEVAKQHERGVVGRAKTPHEFEHLLEGRARLERAEHSRLDDLAIGHRVRERDTELDEVRAPVGEPAQDRERGLEVGIACGDVGDKRRASFPAKAIEKDADVRGGVRGGSVVAHAGSHGGTRAWAQALRWGRSRLDECLAGTPCRHDGAVSHLPATRQPGTAPAPQAH